MVAARRPSYLAVTGSMPGLRLEAMTSVHRLLSLSPRVRRRVFLVSDTRVGVALTPGVGLQVSRHQ